MIQLSGVYCRECSSAAQAQKQLVGLTIGRLVQAHEPDEGSRARDCARCPLQSVFLVGHTSAGDSVKPNMNSSWILGQTKK